MNLRPLLLAPLLAFSTARAGEAPAFNFAGPEIFPLDAQGGSLRAADMDGDGLLDLVVANNARSRIEILLNRTGKPADTRPESRKRELNELPPDARFRIESVASEKRIADLVVADLNGDKRPDLAYYGEPKELVVQYNQGSNTWSAPRRFAIEDGQILPTVLGTGDLNGDKRTDLLVLGEGQFHFLAQKADGTLAEPEKIPFSGTLKSFQVLDVDGDGREDLLMVNWDTGSPVRFRLQNAAGQLGPEIHFQLQPLRGYWADDLDGDRKMEIVTIAANSGRATVSRFGRKAGETLAGGLRAGEFQVLPLNKTTKSARGSAFADVDGDGRADLLVAEPDSGQLTFFAQNKDGSFAAGRTFSTLTGVSDLAVADWDGDGRPEIFLMSGDERQVGVTRFAEGRIAFPTPLPIEGKPLALAVGAPDEKSKPVLAVLADHDGKRTLHLRGADGKTRVQKLGENFKSNPSTLAFHDADQDGLADLIALIPYEKMKLLRQVAGKDHEELDIAPPGGPVEQPWLARADVDGDGKPELLLPQKNFVRAVTLKPDEDGKNWNFAVKEQINGAAQNSRITAAGSLKSAAGAAPLLFLLDAERKALTLCERDKTGAWQAVKNLQLPHTDFSGILPLALGGAQADSLGFLGLNAVAWLPLRGDVWEMKELDGYETPIKDGRLADVVSGDLNKDGRKDLVFLEMARNHLDLVIFDSTGKLVPANRWQVFQERTFRRSMGGLPEPREAVIADFTGDGKNDLAVLVHDRVLVYPQE